jgi:hypothetical protein
VPTGHYNCFDDLYLSPNHNLIINGNRVRSDLLGFSRYITTESFSYYNLELPNFFTDGLFANGVYCESWCGLYTDAYNIYDSNNRIFILKMLNSFRYTYPHLSDAISDLISKIKLL